MHTAVQLTAVQQQQQSICTAAAKLIPNKVQVQFYWGVVKPLGTPLEIKLIEGRLVDQTPATATGTACYSIALRIAWCLQVG